jgi:uncharacterized protein YegL
MSSFDRSQIFVASDRRRHLFFALLLSTLLMTLPARVARCQQQPQEQERPRRVLPPEQEQQDEPVETLRIDTDLIPVDVMVTDVLGKPVRGLRPTDFKLYEDGVERPIAFFNVERKGGVARPIAAVFALDVSGSMTVEEMQRLRGAMSVFSRRLAADRASLFAVMAFGMKVKTLQTLTNDQQKLERAYDRLTREPSGLSTHTYDAVDDAIRMLVKHAPRTRERRLIKRAVVVVTDGFPVGDTVSARTVIERANAADVSVYTVTLPSFSRMVVSTERAPLPTPLDVSGLAEEVTSSYVLAFYPTEEKRRDGRFHTIRIEAPRGLTVRQSRPGYKSGDK